MSAPAPRTLDTPHFALLDRISQRMAERRQVDDLSRRAVTLLTGAADPQRADRLAVQPGEAPALVERLAVWALRRAPADAVAQAARILDEGQVTDAGSSTDTADSRTYVPASRPVGVDALCTAS